jgi:drug/metabolite transporter (DMT)-like permease
MVAVIAIGDRYIDERNRACNWPRPATVPRLPWYDLPLGVTATILMALSAGLAVLAYRRLGATSRWQWSVGLLAAVAVLGALFAAWFGIHAVLADSGTPLHCGG